MNVRRVLLAALGLVAALTWEVMAGEALPPDLGSRRQGQDWPVFLGPSRDSKSAETGILTEWPAAGPRGMWVRVVGEGYSMPSVARGRLFLFDRDGDVERLVALNSETGEELWQRSYPTHYEDDFGFSNGPRASPVVDGERVCIFGVEGRLRCHRVTDGALLWEVDAHRRFGVQKNFFGAASSPVVEGNMLLVAVGGSAPGSPDVYSGRQVPNGTAIVAFDKRSGEVRYTLGDDLASYSSPVVTDLGGRRLGLYFARSGLLAFDPTAGRVLLQTAYRARKLYSVNAATPVVAGDGVFITEAYGPGGVLLRLERQSNGLRHTVVWRDSYRTPSLASHWATPVAHAGYLYGSNGEHSGSAELRCVEHGSGRVVWSQPGLRRVTLLYVDRHFVVLGEYGELLLIEATPERFHPVSRVILREGEGAGTGPPLLRHPAWSAPILSHGLLYVRGRDRLVCLELIPERRRPGTDSAD